MLNHNRALDRVMCIHSNDLWGDRSPKPLAMEWSERSHFKFLNIARRPVIQNNEAKDMLFGILDVENPARFHGLGDENTHFKFHVQPSGRREDVFSGLIFKNTIRAGQSRLHI